MTAEVRRAFRGESWLSVRLSTAMRRLTLHRLTLVSLGLLLCHVSWAAGPATVAELAARVEALVSEARFGGAVWGVKVVSLDTGATLVERNPSLLLSPASNCKLYVGALALDSLGGDYRIATPLFAGTKPDAAGVVQGDLVVAGRGDPSWRVRKGGAGTFDEIFVPFVEALRTAGVRRIAGGVVADGTWLRTPPHGAGWTVDDMSDYYGAEVSAVALADNCVRLRYAPGSAAGAPAVLEWLEPLAGLTLENRVVTLPAVGEAAGERQGGAKAGKGAAPAHIVRFYTQRYPGERLVRTWGELSLGAEPKIEDIPVPRPADWFAAALREALVKAGIAVDGGSRGVRWPEASPLDAAAGVRVGALAAPVKIGEVVSPPMRELVRDFMKPSQNLQTNLIFAHVGEQARAAGAKERRTSEQQAVDALEAFLRKSGLPADEVRFEEGSGLSRNNMATVNATVRLLVHMAGHAEAEAFRDSLPIAGEDGSLRLRMKGTAAQGNVRAKTGSLRWAASLSGYVTSAAGERLAFSLMLNRYSPPEGRSARAELDTITVWLAQLAGRSATR